MVRKAAILSMGAFIQQIIIGRAITLPPMPTALTIEPITNHPLTGDRSIDALSINLASLSTDSSTISSQLSASLPSPNPAIGVQLPTPSTFPFLQYSIDTNEWRNAVHQGQDGGPQSMVSIVKSEFLPVLDQLRQDDIDTMRCLTADVCVALALCLSSGDLQAITMPLIESLLDDVSWKVRLRLTENFPKVCITLFRLPFSPSAHLVLDFSALHLYTSRSVPKATLADVCSFSL